MNRKTATLAMLAIAAATAAYMWHRALLRYKWDAAFSPELRKTLDVEGEVTAQRLHHREGGSAKELDDYLKGEIVPVSSSNARALETLLLNAASYEWRTDVGKNCVLDYGVLVIFRSPGHVIRVAFCFNCDSLGLYDGTKDTFGELHRAEFDPAHKQFATVVKTIFPHDPEIQGIR